MLGSNSVRFFALLKLTILATVYAGVGPTADLHIVNKVISPDGFSRSAVLAGSSATNADFPGALITANKGDTFNLNVINSLRDSTMLRSTSIHWHGFFQAGTSWADGPVGVTQCPITPDHSFLYSFPAHDQAGTFWYHSHLSTQYCDGLRGAMVVYNPNDPHRSLYDIDNDDTVITLADWYHVPAPSAGPVPTPDSTLINGKGRYANGPASSLSVINVIYGKRYRFRLVSLSCDSNFMFSIDDHPLTIIEVDGNDIQPWTVDTIQIFAGQRYSFVVNANQTGGNYWVRALPNLPPNSNFNGGLNSAILRYAGKPVEDPTSSGPKVPKVLRETDLHPLVNPAAPGLPSPGGADVVQNLAITFSGGRFSVNGASFVPPSQPVLLQILSGATDPGSILPPGSVYFLPPNKVVELTLPGGSIGSPHPIHLHGHAFSVVRSANSSVYNYANPVRRDVVSIGSQGDQVTIRFTTDNPGPWVLHCHIDWHFELGLAVVFAEDPKTVNTQNPPAPWHDLCPIYNATNPDHR